MSVLAIGTLWLVTLWLVCGAPKPATLKSRRAAARKVLFGLPMGE